MGLDMYLNAKRGIYEFRNDPEATWPGLPDGYRIDSISVEAAYWRKANQIHDWFVQNVQNGEDECRPHHVERDKLAELVGLCQQVLADHDKAKDLLPTKDGFFFGSTDYDQYYFDDLRDTVEMLNKALAAFDDTWSFEYQSSW